jgi:hypothetical protein
VNRAIVNDMPLPCLVLTAGLGTRLRPLTDILAKPALPVAGQPLVARILRWLASQGVNDAVLNLSHLPHTVSGVAGDGSQFGIRVRYSWEQPVLGSAGGPRHALPLLGSRFLIVNGDTLTKVPLSDVIGTHTRSGAAVTMALVPHPAPGRYGGVHVNDAGWPGDPHPCDRTVMPAPLMALVDRSRALYERVWRFDAALYSETAQPTDNPVMRQIDRLRQAAEGGAFDPLAVWRRD